jgi:hypothetical protein
MKLYNGDKLIEDYENIKYDFRKIISDKNDTDINDYIENGDSGVFYISRDIITGDTNIECVATYKGTSYSKILFIDLEQTPYELEINKNVLTRDANVGGIIDEFLIVRVKYWSNGDWVYTPDGIVKATTESDEHTYYFGNPTGQKYDRIFTIGGSELEDNTKDIEVRISYLKEDELSYKNISITDEYTIHLELTKNYIEVPTNVNSDGSDPDFTDSITSQMKLYTYVLRKSSSNKKKSLNIGKSYASAEI